MRKERKILAAALAVLCAGALTACGSTAPVSEKPPVETPAVEVEASPVPERDYTGMLVVSELMTKNHATLTDGQGDFCDWIELTNVSDETIELAGWSVSDKEGRSGRALDGGSLAPGEFLLLYASELDEPLHTGFALSAGETVYVLDPYGREVSSHTCTVSEADRSEALVNGAYVETALPSPGYANDRAGYEAYCSARKPSGPLVINEIAPADRPDDRHSDWVELKNISDAAVELSDYFLSDDDDNYFLFRLPEKRLEPGELVLVYCEDDPRDSDIDGIVAPFSLNIVSDTLFLSERERMLDYALVRAVPAGASLGRVEGEEGFFYLAAPSPAAENGGEAYRFITEKPVPLTPDGIYNGVDGVTVELRGEGTVYYTTDSSVPQDTSPVYAEPLHLDKTTVIRAYAQEPGCMASPVVTLTYVINENHTMPVLSLVTDSAEFGYVYERGIKYYPVAGAVTLYGTEHDFSSRCGVSMKGWTSLQNPKKSMGLSFNECYGDGNLYCDVFRNGVTRYASLSVRAGQDYPLAMFRNELFQRLCAEGSDALLTQNSEYCILYLNGKYYGVYCIKEDFDRQFYASTMGVSKGSVTPVKSPFSYSAYPELGALYSFCLNSDMADSDNYAHFCEQFDVDSLIDWMIFEGYCANSDLNGNMRYFRSPEDDGRWRLAFYDLDWSFNYLFNTMHNVFDIDTQISGLIHALMHNKDFCRQYLRRTVELAQSVLSDEYVLSLIDEYETLLEPEMLRERNRWGGSVEDWHYNVQKLRSYILDNDYANLICSRASSVTGIPLSEIG